MKVVTLIAVGTLSAGLMGCGLFKGGRTMASYRAGTPPVATRTTEASATYALYSVAESRPVVTVVLPQGTQIGFRHGAVGQIVAVAGDQEFPISPNGDYYWKRIGSGS